MGTIFFGVLNTVGKEVKCLSQNEINRDERINQSAN